MGIHQKKLYAVRFRLTRRMVTIAAVSSLFLGVAGCRQSTPPGPSPSPAATTAVSTPSASPVEVASLSIAEITEQYESPVDETQNGLPTLLPLLTDEAQTERLSELSLEKKDDLKYFDTKVSPLLATAFRQPYFLPAHKLLSGQQELNYRSLRRLVELITERAQLHWEAGQKDKALELVGLPLTLAKAMQSRAETVSVNLFSSSYANFSLDRIDGWLAEGQLNAKEMAQLSKLLAENRPNYDHLEKTISVDFSQISNSLNDPDTRSSLGMSFAKPEEIAGWQKELLSLYGPAKALYATEAIDPKAFNEAVLKVSPQLQGLVIDYPTVVTMQKHAFSAYLATELALTTESHRLSKDGVVMEQSSLVKEAFADDERAGTIADAFLEMKKGSVPGTFQIVGRGSLFELMSPGAPAVFYEH